MSDGDRRKILSSGSVKPAGAGATDFSPSVEFTMLPGEHVRCWGRVMVQATATLQDWNDASDGFYFSVERVASGTPSASAFTLVGEILGSALTTEFTITTDANGLVKVQFTKQNYRGSIWLEGFGCVQAEA